MCAGCWGRGGARERPRRERVSHYFEARIAKQFDAVIHFDVTRAASRWTRSRMGGGDGRPDTYRTGI